MFNYIVTQLQLKAWPNCSHGGLVVSIVALQGWDPGFASTQGHQHGVSPTLQKHISRVFWLPMKLALVCER